MPLPTKHIATICAIAMLLASCPRASASSAVTFPNDTVARVDYAMQIDFKDAYLSGICVMVKNGDEVAACLVNEFGVTLLSFIYDISREKIKLEHTIKPISRWYIKRTLKRDLKAIMPIMQQGGNSYYNKKRKITYSFELLHDEDDNEEL